LGAIRGSFHNKESAVRVERAQVDRKRGEVRVGSTGGVELGAKCGRVVGLYEDTCGGVQGLVEDFFYLMW